MSKKFYIIIGVIIAAMSIGVISNYLILNHCTKTGSLGCYKSMFCKNAEPEIPEGDVSGCHPIGPVDEDDNFQLMKCEFPTYIGKCVPKHFFWIE